MSEQTDTQKPRVTPLMLVVGHAHPYNPNPDGEPERGVVIDAIAVDPEAGQLGEINIFLTQDWLAAVRHASDGALSAHVTDKAVHLPSYPEDTYEIPKSEADKAVLEALIEDGLLVKVENDEQGESN